MNIEDYYKRIQKHYEGVINPHHSSEAILAHARNLIEKLIEAIFRENLHIISEIEELQKKKLKDISYANKIIFLCKKDIIEHEYKNGLTFIVREANDFGVHPEKREGNKKYAETTRIFLTEFLNAFLSRNKKSLEYLVSFNIISSKKQKETKRKKVVLILFGMFFTGVVGYLLGSGAYKSFRTDSKTSPNNLIIDSLAIDSINLGVTSTLNNSGKKKPNIPKKAQPESLNINNASTEQEIAKQKYNKLNDELINLMNDFGPNPERITLNRLSEAKNKLSKIGKSEMNSSEFLKSGLPLSLDTLKYNLRVKIDFFLNRDFTQIDSSDKMSEQTKNEIKKIILITELVNELCRLINCRTEEQEIYQNMIKSLKPFLDETN